METIRNENGLTITLDMDEIQALKLDLELIPTKQSSYPEFLERLRVALVKSQIPLVEIAGEIAKVASTIRNKYDRQDMLELADMVRNGKLDHAKKFAASRDTYVRDQIPKIAWDVVGLRPLR